MAAKERPTFPRALRRSSEAEGPNSGKRWDSLGIPGGVDGFADLGRVGLKSATWDV